MHLIESGLLLFACRLSNLHTVFCLQISILAHFIAQHMLAGSDSASAMLLICRCSGRISVCIDVAYQQRNFSANLACAKA